MSPLSRPPFRAGTVWTHDLRQPPVGISLLPHVTFERIDLAFAARLAQNLSATQVTEVEQRLAGGRRCYTAWAEDRLAGYGWVSFQHEEVQELGVRLQLQPCEAYIWDCYTFPAFRQLHIYAALLVWMLQQLGEEGLCRAWIGANMDNLPSQRGIDRAGFTRVADLLISREGGQRVLRLEGYPGVPESLVIEARRVFLSSLELHRL